jgi:TP901 family phage tail tape measure protein
MADDNIIIKINYDTIDAQNNVTELTKDLENLEKQQKEVKDEVKKGIRTQEDADKILLKQKETAKQLRRERNQNIKVLVAEKNSINALKAANNALIKKSQDLDLSTRKGRKEFKRYSKEINKNTEQLKKADAMQGRFQRNVGNYPTLFGKARKAFVGFANALKASVILAAMAAIAKGFKALVTNSLEFEKSLSSLQAITGVSSEELTFFADTAKEFSEQTLQSANDIVKAFELVGSLRPELLANKEALAEVTKQAIILSEATGGKLGLEESANAVAGALNQFSLESDQASRAINVLAAGSQKGAAAIPALTEGLTVFGAVADAGNVTLEQSVGLLETLAEKNIQGAEAGTKLRNILITLQGDQENYTDGVFDLNKALTNLSNENLTVTELTQKFGKQNVVAAQILVNNVDKYEDYTEAVTGTNTALEQQAIQNDNLAANWKKFVNKISNALTSSKVSDFLNKIVKNLINFFNISAAFFADTRDKFNELIEQSAVFRATIVGIKEGFKTALKVVKAAIINGILEPIKLVGRVMSRVFKGEWSEIGNEFKTTGDRVKQNVIDIKDEIVDSGKKIKEAYQGKNLDEMLIKTKEAKLEIDNLTMAIDQSTEAVANNTKEVDKNAEKRAKAIEKLAKLKEEAILKEITDEEEKKNKLIEIETKRYESAIENEELLKEELELLEFEHQTRMDEIKEEFAQKELERKQALYDQTIGDFDRVLDAAGMFQNERIAQTGELTQTLLGFQKQRLAGEKITLGQIADLSNQLTGLITANNQDQLDDLDRKKESELALVGENTEAKKEIEARYAQKRNELLLAQFKEEKAKSIIDTIVATAVAAVNALKLGPVAGPIAAGVIGTLGAIQTAKIAGQRPPVFSSGQIMAEGGELPFGGKILGGNYHTQGGTKLYGSDGTIAEAERDEGIFIMKRSATAELAALSAHNQAHGGRSFFSGRHSFMQDGGELATGGIDVNDLSTAIAEQIANLNIFVRVTDINEAQGIETQVTNNGIV